MLQIHVHARRHLVHPETSMINVLSCPRLPFLPPHCTFVHGQRQHRTSLASKRGTCVHALVRLYAEIWRQSSNGNYKNNNNNTRNRFSTTWILQMLPMILNWFVPASPLQSVHTAHHQLHLPWHVFLAHQTTNNHPNATWWMFFQSHGRLWR